MIRAAYVQSQVAKWCIFSIQILVTPKIWLPAPTHHNSSAAVPLFISDIVNKVWMSMLENRMYYIPCIVQDFNTFIHHIHSER
jgi:hypothetical protein